MKKHNNRKLNLSKETLRFLTAGEAQDPGKVTPPWHTETQSGCVVCYTISHC